MEYFVEQGRTHTEAMEKVRAKYGPHAKVMHHRSVRMGGFLGLFTHEGVEVTGYISQAAQKRADNSFEEQKKRFLGSVAEKRGGEEVTESPAPADMMQSDNNRRDAGDSRAMQGSGGAPRATLDTLLQEVKTLRSTIETRSHDRNEVAVGGDHPTVARIRDLLELNEFTTPYIRMIVDRLKREFALEELAETEAIERRVVDWIGESIQIDRYRPEGNGHVFILVGPTGVGKTTTIAKLAAMWGIEQADRPAKDVRMITIDNYRIGARQQIETYGEIMGIPVHAAENYADLEKQIAVYRDVDVVFVDTIGKSPRDYVKIGEMKEQLDACGQGAVVHLAVSATTKPSDLEAIIQQYEPFGCRSVVATKLDETARIGSLVSVLHARGKALCYLTVGQRVPIDIEPARVTTLLRKLEGFHIDRSHIEERFSMEAVGDEAVPVSSGYAARA